MLATTGRIPDNAQLAQTRQPGGKANMNKLCWAQTILSGVAAVACVAEVETILWSGPSMAGLGLCIALVSARIDSVRLLVYGVWCPIVTGVIAMLIATLQIGPMTASKFVWALLAFNAIVTAAAWQFLRHRPHPHEVSNRARRPVRFSILHMLIGTTLVALVLSVVRPFIGLGEMTLFAVYGIAVLMTSLGILLWYALRSSSEPSVPPMADRLTRS